MDRKGLKQRRKITNWCDYGVSLKLCGKNLLHLFKIAPTKELVTPLHLAGYESFFVPVILNAF